MTLLLHILKLFILFFVLLVGLVYITQRHLIYFPEKTLPNSHDFLAARMMALSLVNQEGIRLNAWYKPAQGRHPTLLFLPGNAGNMSHRLYIARQFMQQGFGILLFDYRGYGGNSGKPTEQGLYDDGTAALAFLIQQGIKPSQLVLYGESLGTAIATYLAVKYSSCALILQSPFTSLDRLARVHYPWMPLTPWDKYDSLARIKNINTPLLIVHGTRDEVVPYDEGVTLFKAALEPKKMLSFTGYGHNDLWHIADYTQLLNKFILRHCSAK